MVMQGWDMGGIQIQSLFVQKATKVAPGSSARGPCKECFAVVASGRAQESKYEPPSTGTRVHITNWNHDEKVGSRISRFRLNAGLTIMLLLPRAIRPIPYMK